VESYGLALFDLQFRRESIGWVLRVMIDRPWDPESQGKESAVKYHVALDRRLSLEDLSAQLTTGASAITSVVWKNPKKSGK